MAGYYDALRWAGRSYWNAAAAFEADGRLDEAAKGPLRVYKGRVIDAMTRTHNFCLQDAGAFELKLVRDEFQKVYSTADASVEKAPVAYNPTVETNVGEIWQLDETKTATNYANRVGSTPAKMGTLITGWLAGNAASPEGQAHQKALVAAKQGLNYVTTDKC
jgi:hypothetical protein